MEDRPDTRHKTRHRGITYRKLANGTRRYFVFATGRQVPVEGGEAEAVALQAELRGKAARGQKILPSKVKLAELTAQWLAAKKGREGTLADYKADLDNVVLPRFGHLKPAQISTDQIAAFIRDLEQQGLSGSRINNICKPLKQTLDLAVRRGMIGQNPWGLLTADERPKLGITEHHVWSSQQIKSVLSAAAALARKRDAKYDYTRILTVGFYTGLRISELLALRWCDVDLKEKEISVRHQLSKKGGKLIEPKTPKAIRRIPLAPDLVKTLGEHKLASDYSKETDFVFASNKGTPLNARNVATRGLAPALEAAGLGSTNPKITFHDLRHAFASIMIERGVNATVLADLMGHTSSVTTLRIYAHLFDRQRTDEAVRAAMQSAMRL